LSNAGFVVLNMTGRDNDNDYKVDPYQMFVEADFVAVFGADGISHLVVKAYVNFMRSNRLEMRMPVRRTLQQIVNFSAQVHRFGDVPCRR
jgi:hypothetical protein